MYLYIDESGDLKQPLEERSETVAVFVVLAVKDNESRKKLYQIVNRSRINFQRRLQREGKWPAGKKIVALKGSANRKDNEKGILGLNRHPTLRLWLFEKIVKQVKKIDIHVFFIRKEKYKQIPPQKYHRAYGAFLREIIKTLHVHKFRRQTQMILDKRFENIKPRVALTKMLISFWISRINLRGWLQIHHNETETDKGLQLADIICNFCYQYKHLQILRRPHYVKSIEIYKMEATHRQWFETFDVLQPIIKVWRENPEINPGKLKPPHKISNTLRGITPSIETS